jgi:ligand-binding sensor domain-containing protein/tRNA A-37 threonylcarbamoyl transferase component Bud32
MDNIQPGQTLGAYRIVNQIGQGGMATVYKAYHAAMDRYVAVKVLPKQFAESSEFMGRFQQEARTIANLEHPHILPVYDYGAHDNIPYFVMRYLDTGTLKDRIKAGPISLAEADRLFTQLADALGYAHERGVIHRDIKPSNALVDSRGGLFLTDFGIAKLTEGAAQFTATGAITGTPAYMSPEQAQGEKIDHRSDIYSLGIVLYEMVTGRVPFEAETPLAVIFKQIQANLPPPSEANPEVSPEVERVLLKALAKNREDRFNTCGEFLDAWKGALAKTPTAKFQPPPVAAPSIPSAPMVVTPAAEAPAAKAGTGVEAAPKKRNWRLALIGGGVILLCGVLFCGAAIVRQAGLNQRATAAARTPASTEAAPDTSAPTPALLETPPATTIDSTVAEEWTSWTAANSITSILVHGDEVYTLGPGGVTVWDRADGSVVRQYTTANGLPSPRVFAMLVDEDGTLWVGTEAGLARIADDGQTILYNTQDGLDSDTVSALARDGERLLVGTKYSDQIGGGLNVFEGGSWSRYPDFPSAHPDKDPGQLANFVNVIFHHPDGSLWVGTENGLGYFDGSWRRFSTDEGLPGNNILSIFSAEDGLVLVGTEKGAAQFNGERFEAFDHSPPDGVLGLAQDGQGRYYFSGGGGIWQYDPDLANWEEFSNQNGALPTYSINGAAQDEEGVLYFGTWGAGLIRYDGDAFTTWTAPNTPSRGAYGRIIPAPDGSLWFVELYGVGVDRFDPASETWNELTDSPCNCEPVKFDRAGNLWGREWPSGVWIMPADGGDPQRIGEAEGLPPEAFANDIAFGLDGIVWFATSSGLARYDGQAVQLIAADEIPLPDNEMERVFVASDGSLWVAGGSSMARLRPDGAWEGFDMEKPFKSYIPQVHDFAEDADGAIWAATDNGIYRLVGDQWQAFIPGQGGVNLPNAEFITAALAPDGSLWFGTSHNGAARYDGADWETFTAGPEALISNGIYDIYEDGSGTVWFAADGGVTRYHHP